MFKHYSYDEKDSTNIANHDNLDAFYDCYDIGLPRASIDRRSNMNDQNRKDQNKYSNSIDRKDQNKSSNSTDKKESNNYSDSNNQNNYSDSNNQNRKDSNKKN